MRPKRLSGSFALLAFLMVALSASPAVASHNPSVWFPVADGDHWNEGVSTRTFCVSQDFGQILPPTRAAYAAETIENAVNRYENNTQLDINFQTFNSPCGDFSFAARWNTGGGPTGFCSLTPEAATSSVQYDGIGADGPYGRTVHCDTDNNGRIDYFAININSDRVTEIGTQWDWHTDPSPNEKDLLGLVSHEFGHALGFEGHFGEGSSVCPENPDRHTMCPGSLGFKYSQGSDGKWSRTLEPNDITTFNIVY